MARRGAVTTYIPLYLVLFGVAVALLKQIGARYIVKRQWTLRPLDVGIAALLAAFTYGSFRLRYGRRDEAHWYKR